ncbi:sugar nucleotide-binding protein [Haloechinothrix sp. YIM 98757]|uniref:Sugar nucleotide-binding protein n=1 Tax=Haloechinothrix aidingensis TaxID=2752311 RepID=A0A838A451_9PSEU|nr:sugar nucleotide-binding protein [Haloechinothrix aidingensis]MBA0124360.1 sugar nucleotide-binding protein [Haloechinothrix aidingensis]
MSVLLAGCGDLGTEAALRFAATGRRVVALRRSAERLPAAVEGRSVDLARQVPEVPGDTDIVVIVVTADRRTADGYRSTYVDGLANTLAGVERAGARPSRVLLVSSTSVYGTDDGSWVDEDTLAEPASATGSVLVEAERTLHDRVPGSIVLRLAGLYGPGRGALLERVRDGVPVSNAASYTNRIHRDDAAAAIVHLTTRVDEPAAVYLGADHAPVTRGEIVRFLAGQLDVPAPELERAGSPRGKRFRNDRLVASGFTFEYPTYREGYRAVLAGHGTPHR